MLDTQHTLAFHCLLNFSSIFLVKVRILYFYLIGLDFHFDEALLNRLCIMDNPTLRYRSKDKVLISKKTQKPTGFQLDLDFASSWVNLINILARTQGRSKQNQKRTKNQYPPEFNVERCQADLFQNQRCENRLSSNIPPLRYGVNSTSIAITYSNATGWLKESSLFFASCPLASKDRSATATMGTNSLVHLVIHSVPILNLCILLMLNAESRSIFQPSYLTEPLARYTSPMPPWPIFSRTL